MCELAEVYLTVAILCLEGFYVPLIYAQSPGTFKASATFGQVTDAKESRCPQNKSVISVSGSFNVDENVKEHLNALEKDESCPKGIIKFTPPMFLLKCKDRFSPFTKITNLALQIKPNRSLILEFLKRVIVGNS
uniref:Uncharacterized protein n=1 Tax=Phlebotomus papatasi TaxID=29031 RepID=A0A1B0DIE7_PHLPP